jgi:hypothetical protein
MSEIYNADRYPDTPGHRGVDTSIAAADAIAPKCGRLQKLALDAILTRRALGRTVEETSQATGVDERSIQPRISELRVRRLIVDSGHRRRNSTGKRAIVWVGVEYGPDADGPVAS